MVAKLFKFSFDTEGRMIESPFTEVNFREDGTNVILCLIGVNGDDGSSKSYYCKHGHSASGQ